MQAIDELIPWEEQQIKHEARVLAAKMAAEARAEARKEMLPTLRRSLAHRARDRFGERIARLLSAEIESVEDPAAFDRICNWLDTCESGESLLALVQTG